MAVYILSDPREADLIKRIRYVGVTSNARLRFSAHMANTIGSPAKRAWIDGLKQAGLEVVMELLDTGTEPEWIQSLAGMGAVLLNERSTVQPCGQRPESYYQERLEARERVPGLAFRRVRRPGLPGGNLRNQGTMPAYMPPGERWHDF